jgi:uncharacterized membrane protein YkvA (DUF1232 family)
VAFIETIRQWARRIKRDALMLWFASRHPETPWLAKLLCVVAVAYALSPIDLIPDFIPVLGFVDDALLLPALIWLALRLLPAHVIASCRVQAQAWMDEEGTRPKSHAGAAVIILIWLVAAYLGWRWWQSP